MKRLLQGMAVGVLLMLPGVALQAAEVTLEVLNPDLYL